MLLPRIIPCLLLSKNDLVKTINFRNPKYIGDPINAVKIFNEKKADELFLREDLQLIKYPTEIVKIPRVNFRQRKVEKVCVLPLFRLHSVDSSKLARVRYVWTE